MKLNNSFLFLLLLTIVSCGVKNDDLSYSNPFISNWKLSGIDCYDTDLNGAKKEIYPNNNADTNEIIFTGRTFIYSVSEGGGDCNTSANGTYLIDYTNGEEGKISYSSITNSLQCSITHAELAGVGSGLIPFGFITSASNTTSLDWKVTGDELILEVSTGFKGTETISSYCLDACTCYSRYTKDTSN
jgi:hypothetical protein